MEHLINYILQKNKIPNHNQLAKILKVSHATILRWLKDSDRPSVYNCMKLSKLSGCPLDYIISIIYPKESQ